MTGLFLPARAKCNLVLRVVGRRADGYHRIETLFHALDLHDDLWLQAAPHGIDLAVSADRPERMVGNGEDNLVVRALQRLSTAAGHGGGFRAHLHKRIPHGGGLGGGSSDAAAALRLGNALLERPLDPATLHSIAQGLGADVAFFLRGGSQWGRGVGDELMPAEVAPLHFVLLVPPFACPTADVYKNYAAHWNGGAPQASVPAVTLPTTKDSAVRFGFSNDLSPAAERVRPALRALRQRVHDLGYPDVHMTGSGSTLFVPFAGGEAAARCAHDLAVLSAAGVGCLVTRSAPAGEDVAVERPWPEPGDGGV